MLLTILKRDEKVIFFLNFGKIILITEIKPHLQ